MHGSRGQHRPDSKQNYGQNLLLTVACQDDHSPYAYSNESFHQSSHHQTGSKNKSHHLSKSQQCTNSKKESLSGSLRDEWRMRPHRCVDEESLFSLNFPTSQQQIRKGAGNRTTSSSSPPGRRKFVYRCFQVFSILILGISVYALVENIKYLIRTYDGDVDELSQGIGNSFVNINEELQSWLNTSPDPLSSTTTNKTAEKLESSNKFVLNINSLSFDINNESLCKSTPHHFGDGVYFMIIVHSAPTHFQARQVIRSTWGSLKTLKNVAFKLVFVTGRSEEDDEDADLVESSMHRESEIFGDIVTGSFIDSYKNLTYKHLLGYKWAINFCPDSTFILKADDDAFIDIFQLFDFISRTYGHKPSPGTLICNVFPEGSKPVRATDTQGQKWLVNHDEYSLSIYPKYCGGLAYLVTPDVIKRILNVSDKVRFFWIDDVFVTGILRQLAGVDPFYLNLRYSYEPERYRKWLNFKDTNNASTMSSELTKLPFMIAHVERGPKFSEEMHQLWKKTKNVWGKEFGAAM